MDPEKAYKEKMGNAITRRLISAIENKVVDENEGSLIAGYIVDRLTQITTSAEVFDLVTELSEKWPFFKDILSAPNSDDAEKAKEQAQQMENNAIDKASDLLKHNKIDEAIQIVEQANQASSSLTEIRPEQEATQ